MRKILVTLIVLMCLLVPTAVAQAATSDTVVVSATPSYLTISVEPASFTFGGPGAVLDESTTWYASTNTSSYTEAIHTSKAPFKVTNGSSVRIDVSINSTAWTGGTPWTVAADGNPGDNVLGLKAGVNGTDVTNMIVVKTGTPNVLKVGTAVGEDWAFDMVLFTPTVFDDGELKTGTILVSAATQ